MKDIKISWKKITRFIVVVVVVIVLVGIVMGYGLAELLEFITDLW